MPERFSDIRLSHSLSRSYNRPKQQSAPTFAMSGNTKLPDTTMQTHERFVSGKDCCSEVLCSRAATFTHASVVAQDVSRGD